MFNTFIAVPEKVSGVFHSAKNMSLVIVSFIGAAVVTYIWYKWPCLLVLLKTTTNCATNDSSQLRKW